MMDRNFHVNKLSQVCFGVISVLQYGIIKVLIKRLHEIIAEFALDYYS